MSGGAYELVREPFLPAPPSAVFPFFADAHNLGRITPGCLHFCVIPPNLIAMATGARIAHAVAVRRALAAIFEYRFARIEEIRPWES